MNQRPRVGGDRIWIKETEGGETLTVSNSPVPEGAGADETYGLWIYQTIPPLTFPVRLRAAQTFHNRSNAVH